MSVAASQVSAGPDPGLTYSSAGLPPGLSLSPRGLISGSPAASVDGQQETITAACGAVLGSVRLTWNVTGPVTVTAPAGGGSWLRSRATGRCLTDPAPPGTAFATHPAAVAGPCSAAAPGAAWHLR